MAATIGYEVRIVNGPRKIIVRGEVFELASGNDDVTVLMRVTRSPTSIVDEKIVGVIGNEWRSDASEMLNIREFLKSGGVVEWSGV